MCGYVSGKPDKVMHTMSSRKAKGWQQKDSKEVKQVPNTNRLSKPTLPDLGTASTTLEFPS